MEEQSDVSRCRQRRRIELQQIRNVEASVLAADGE